MLEGLRQTISEHRQRAHFKALSFEARAQIFHGYVASIAREFPREHGDMLVQIGEQCIALKSAQTEGEINHLRTQQDETLDKVPTIEEAPVFRTALRDILDKAMVTSWLDS